MSVLLQCFCGSPVFLLPFLPLPFPCSPRERINPWNLGLFFLISNPFFPKSSSPPRCPIVNLNVRLSHYGVPLLFTPQFFPLSPSTLPLFFYPPSPFFTHSFGNPATPPSPVGYHSFSSSSRGYFETVRYQREWEEFPMSSEFFRLGGPLFLNVFLNISQATLPYKVPLLPPTYQLWFLPASSSHGI